MKGSRVVAPVLVLLMFCGLWTPAMAKPAPEQLVLYTIEFVASGTAGAASFADERIVLAGVTDTATAETLAELAEDVSANFLELSQIITALGDVAGFIFVVAALLKVWQAKQNPTHVRLTAEVSFTGPVGMLVVRDGTPVTLGIDSIHNNSIELRTHPISNLIGGK